MSRTTVTVTTEIDLSPDVVAKWFCGLNDEEQADFFIACAKEAATWPAKNFGAWYQWWLVGKHLATCECSTPLAREMVDQLHAGLHAEEK